MDNRYSTYGFKYLIEFSRQTQVGTGVLDFDRCRRWFNDQFGWSQDVDTRSALEKNRRYNRKIYNESDINQTWAYAVRFGDYQIYVKDEAALSWFVISHPNET